MKKFWTIFLFSLLSLTGWGQNAKNPYNGHYYNEKIKMNIYLDLDSASIVVPGLEFFGATNGYMRGGINGLWLLVKHEEKDGGYLLRFSNDQGGDSQDIFFKMNADGTYHYEARGGNEVKRAVGRKLVKIEPVLTFVRKKN